MATNNQDSLRDELASYNHDLDASLRSRVGMSLKTFKTIKALAQLTGAIAGGYAMSQGAPPFATFILIATVVSGPEVLEYFIEAQGGGE
ncbi:hypothetical protein [Halobacterium sp. BOL4-2]|uniref:hypothetical protein n=2 Tax=Halobacterium TaxID=2239 RepID=UPI001ABC6701|nr:hypothetical protein [Halobacterium sp. BOL4-2]QRY26375.1 hypothetical protein JRZ79_13070 [Halobacterium sp. BOL4-2]